MKTQKKITLYSLQKATNSVKAMESEHRKKNMKSARIIKSIYKKKGKNEISGYIDLAHRLKTEDFR